MNNRHKFVLYIFLLAAVTLSSALQAGQFQREAASKTEKFQTVSKADPAWQKALDAHDLSAAAKMIGHPASFKGTVSKVYESRDGDIVILDFDENYRTALTAVLKKADFGKFPDLRELSGKEVLVSGTFVDYQGKPEIPLTSPDQIKVGQ